MGNTDIHVPHAPLQLYSSSIDRTSVWELRLRRTHVAQCAENVTIMLLPPFPGNSPLQLLVGVFSLIVKSFCGNVRKKWCTVTQNVVLTHAHALRDNKNKLWWFEGCWARIFCSLLVSLKRRKKAERAWWKKRGRLSADWRPLGERETD